MNPLPTPPPKGRDLPITFTESPNPLPPDRASPLLLKPLFLYFSIYQITTFLLVSPKKVPFLANSPCLRFAKILQLPKQDTFVVYYLQFTKKVVFLSDVTFHKPAFPLPTKVTVKSYLVNPPRPRLGPWLLALYVA